MKRSIISLVIFSVFVLCGVFGEFIYANNLAKEIDSHTENFKEEESCDALKKLFNKRRFINRLFLRESIIERFELYFTELENGVKFGLEAKKEETLEKIKFYTKDLHQSRLF